MSHTISTKTYKTKGGIEVVYREAITYGESQRIADIYRQDDTKVAAIDKIHQADKLNVETVLVSINGVDKDLYAEFSALPLPDAKEIATIIKGIIDPKVTPEANEPSPSSPTPPAMS